MYIYFCFMNHKSVSVNFLKNMILKIESILAHVFLQSWFDVNTDRPVNTRTQCGVLCIDVCFLQFLQIFFTTFTYYKNLRLKLLLNQYFTFKLNENQWKPQIIWSSSTHKTTIPYGEPSVRRFSYGKNFLWWNFLAAKFSDGKNSLRRNFLRCNFPRRNFLRRNFLAPPTLPLNYLWNNFKHEKKHPQV